MKQDRFQSFIDDQNNDGRHQPIAFFAPGVLGSGYHMDLRGVAASYGAPSEADAWLDLLLARRQYLLPVTILQLGLGSWQRSIDENDMHRSEWQGIAKRVAQWAALDMDGHGRFAHLNPMPHTYRIDPPWHSAMAQGLAVSLLARCGQDSDALRASRSLLDRQFGLVYDTDDGPVLEEYPAEPRPHVLNGWMWALFGLYDLGHLTSCSDQHAVSVSEQALDEWERGVECLVSRLALYETSRGWTTYDLYPHAIANIASPFYHRLHVSMLYAIARIAPQDYLEEQLIETAERWQQALDSPLTRVGAVARKVGFRIVKPRHRRVA